MSKLLIVSENVVFREDLKNQIFRFASDFILLDEEDFEKKTADLIVVDEDIAAYEKLRRIHSATPMIFLGETACCNEDNLNIFLQKPVSLMRFIDVMKAANNKLDNSADGCLSFNDYELYPSRREIKDLLTEKVTKLTEKEVDILKYLYKTPDEYVSKNDLQKNVWRYNGEVATHTIETHIYRLRQKVEKEDGRRLIITDNGGYKLQTDDKCQN